MKASHLGSTCIFHHTHSDVYIFVCLCFVYLFNGLGNHTVGSPPPKKPPKKAQKKKKQKNCYCLALSHFCVSVTIEPYVYMCKMYDMRASHLESTYVSLFSPYPLRCLDFCLVIPVLCLCFVYLFNGLGNHTIGHPPPKKKETQQKTKKHKRKK